MRKKKKSKAKAKAKAGKSPFQVQTAELPAPRFEVVQHPRYPKRQFLLPAYDKATAALLAKPFFFPKICSRPCTSVITLLSKTTVQPSSGIGSFMINIDGFRTINAYVIGERLLSSTERGFTLEPSFAPTGFVPGIGVVGETSHFFNFDTYFNAGAASQPLIHLQTSDLTSSGGVPQLGGVDLTHILRAPVLGPFVRASVFNEGDTARAVEVRAYLST